MTETSKFTAKTWILILSLVLLALTLRPSMASIGPLLPLMQPELHLSFTQASLLTMLPVLAMGLGIFFAHQLAIWFGSYQVVFLGIHRHSCCHSAALLGCRSFRFNLKCHSGGFRDCHGAGCGAWGD